MHVSCIECGYDLHGLGQGAACPECGKATALSFDPTRLVFANRSVVLALLLAFALGFLYHILLAIHITLAVVLALSVEQQEALGQAFNFVAAGALVMASVAFVRCKPRLGSLTFFIAIMLYIVAAVILVLIGEFDFVADSLLTQTAFIAAVWTFYWLVALMMKRIPARGCSRVLSVIGAVLLALGAIELAVNDSIDGAHLATLWFVALFACYVSSACSLTIGLIACLNVLKERRSLRRFVD